MRGVALACLVMAAALAGQESRPASAPVPPPLSREEAESDLAVLEAAIREKWSYLEDKQRHFGVDLDALMARARSRVGPLVGGSGFHDLVLELIADLKDGHGVVSTPGVAAPARRWPVAIVETAEGVVVVKAAPAAEAGSSLVGERLLAADGVPIAHRIAEAERTAIASTPRARRARALARMVRTDAPIVTLLLQANDGRRYAVSVETVVGDPFEVARSRGGAAWATDRPAPGVSRLRVRSFAVADWAGWLEAKPESREAFLADTRSLIDACFREIAGSGALVIDLRGNGGGTDLLGIHLAKHLLPRRFVYFRLSAKHDGAWSVPHGYEHDPLPPDERFDGPLAVLVDEACFSTTDNFLRALIENRPDVIVVGRPTNGGTGAPAAIAKLPNSGSVITLCTQRVSGPAGTITEGRGTRPTIAVEWTAEDHLLGRDPDLAAALEALRRAESRERPR